MKVTMDRFQEAVEAAIDSIPAAFQPYLENTQFVIEKRSGKRLLGLYEGATALEAGEWLPERVTIYKEEHEAEADSWEELVEEVRRTILHEVGHHFGMEEGDLPF
ncbi:MAG: metallopeptidase family protein [Chloroflexi bacterium]|nr:MAG: metallopeptidase family protein [Chloroflexota bacterium]